jgi:hypothetical protein
MDGEDDSVGIEVSADAAGAVSAFDSLSASVDQLGGSVTSLGGAFATQADVINSSVVPTRAAHQALALVGSDIATMAGASSAAAGPMHLLESTLFAVAMGGEAVSGPFIAITAAIAAASYIVKEFAGGANDATAALSTSLKGYKDDTDAINAYTAAGGKLSAALKAVAANTTDATKQTIAGLSATNSAKLATDEETLTIANNTLAYVKRSAARNNDTVGIAASTVAVKNATDAVTADRAAVEANAHGYATWQEYIKGTTTALTANAEAGKKGQAVYDAINAEAVKYIATQEAAAAAVVSANTKEAESFAKFSEASSLGTQEVQEKTAELAGDLGKIPGEYDKMEMAALKYYTDEQNRIQASTASQTQKAAQMVNLAQQESSRLVAIDAQEQAAKTAAVAKWFGASTNYTQELVSYSSTEFKSMASSFGNVAGDMLAKGQNFTTATRGLIANMASEAISHFVTMGVEWAAMKAYQVVTGQAADTASAASSVAITTATTEEEVFAWASVAGAAVAAQVAAVPGVGPAASVEAGIAERMAVEGAFGLLGAAVGADFITDRPTNLLVGEGGEGERVTVTPLSQGGGGSSSSGVGGDTYNFSFGNIVVQGVQDPRAFANQLALYISQAIRGRGQISSVGKSIF